MSEKEHDIADMQVWIFRMAQTKWKMEPEKCAEIFAKWKIFDYIAECYDILHLDSYDLALTDVERYLEQQGAKIC